MEQLKAEVREIHTRIREIETFGLLAMAALVILVTLGILQNYRLSEKIIDSREVTQKVLYQYCKEREAVLNGE